jgi:ariadne-1
LQSFIFVPQQNYSILSEVDIKQRQEDDINRVSTVLSISKSEACVLLRNYNWSVSKVHDEWFADEERVRKIIGLPEKHMELPNDREVRPCLTNFTCSSSWLCTLPLFE